MARILVYDSQEGRWRGLDDSGFKDENEMRKLVQEHPEVLPLDDIAAGTAPIMVIGRNCPLPGGKADVIGVDEDGLLTIIQCRLSPQEGSMGLPVGQILGYAAALWGRSYDEFEADVLRPSGGVAKPGTRGADSLSDAMSEFRAAKQREAGAREEDGWTRERFTENVATNLRLGKCRLVIVVEEADNELRRTIDYLNTVGRNPFRVYCCELKYFYHKDARILMPRLVGVSTTFDSEEEGWSRDRFLRALKGAGKGAAAEVMADLLTWSEENAEELQWSRGGKTGAFTFCLAHGDSPLPVFAAKSDGTIQIRFDALAAAVKKQGREDFAGRLAAIEGVRFPKSDLGGAPHFEASLLHANQGLGEFKKAILWMATDLRAASRTG
jgi:hypothetical protein